MESVLVNSCETWTVTKKLEKKLDRFCTRMLREVKVVSWADRMNNVVLYGDLPKISGKNRVIATGTQN